MDLRIDQTYEKLNSTSFKTDVQCSKLINVKESYDTIDTCAVNPNNMIQKRLKDSTRVRCVSDTCDYNLHDRLPSGTKRMRSFIPSNSSNSLESSTSQNSSTTSSVTSQSTDLKQETVRSLRHNHRRNALNNVSKMALPEVERGRVENEVLLRRKSIKHKVRNFITTRFNLDAEEDLF